MIGSKRTYESAHSEVFSNFSSKRDFYDYMKNHLQVSVFFLYITSLQYYMPPYEMLTRDTIKAILAEDKKLLKLNEVRFIQAPKFDEISVKNLYDKFIKLDKMDKYFPDKYAKGRQCDREYMFNVANTLHSEVVKEVIEYALAQRYVIKEEE